MHDDQGSLIGDLFVYRDLSSEVEVERLKAEMLSLRAARETSASFAGIVGASTAMQRVYWLMKRAMKADVTVLIHGESGTGKELVAKALHANGLRRTGPFLAVNCAAVPEALIESELFGHEQGAFTGATRTRVGCFERARGGTLLLDEIADMKPESQAKLLRVLQERELQRVGGTATIPLDVQVIAATNRNPEAAMRAGAFREDLYYRLAAFPIGIPPLRERREDIPHLVNHVLKRHAERNGQPVKRVHPSAMSLLMAYHWPGNVRELHAAVERAALLEPGDTVQVSRLPAHLRSLPPERGAGGETAAPLLPLAAVERRAVLRALEASDGNVTRAARALGINRATLHRKLKTYGPTSGAAANAGSGD